MKAELFSGLIPNGSTSENNPFIKVADNHCNPMAKYYVYGIRNSLGFDFDPITGKLWDAENGQDLYDEINLVQPGYNSGWKFVMGPISDSVGVTENDLVNFQGSNYADPLLSWEQSRGITELEFLKSDKLGEKYENNILVGDITREIYFSLKLMRIEPACNLKIFQISLRIWLPQMKMRFIP